MADLALQEFRIKYARHHVVADVWETEGARHSGKLPFAGPNGTSKPAPLESPYPYSAWNTE